MVDPAQITKFDRSRIELEHFALFAVAVAGKPADITARKVSTILAAGAQFLGAAPGELRPFEIIVRLGNVQLWRIMEAARLGQYTRIGRAWNALARSGYDLRTVTVAQLELVAGIGQKTSRFIILHSRPDARVAVLDTHILAELRERGHAAPKTTPASMATYAKLEAIVLQLVDESGQSPADWDLAIWMKRRKQFKK